MVSSSPSTVLRTSSTFISSTRPATLKVWHGRSLCRRPASEHATVVNATVWFPFSRNSVVMDTFRARLRGPWSWKPGSTWCMSKLFVKLATKNSTSGSLFVCTRNVGAGSLLNRGGVRT